ncbi:MAG: S41 family peptidase [Acidobacteriota bacterium]
MREKAKLIVLLLSTLIVGYGLVGGILQKVSAGDEAYGDLSVFTRVIDHVRRDYVQEPDMQKALKGALHGMIEALDPFCSFVDKATFDELADRDTSGRLGISLSKRYGYAYIVAVSEGSPADQEGLRNGDLVESIDGQSTVLMSVWEAQRRLAGPPNTEAKVRVIRSRRSEPQELTMQRRVLAVQTPTAEVVERELGYLRIPSLAPGESKVVASKLKMLLSSSVKGLVIDLRSTADGSLSEAVSMSDLFLARGKTIASIEGPDKQTKVEASTSDPVVSDLPVVVLVDGGTSGPAEVLTASLKDNGVAEIVGERTNGHGSIQSEFKLRDGSKLFLSTAMILRPDQQPLQSEELRKSGVAPDVLSPERDFISNFYFENSGDGDEEDLGDDFYTRLDEAVRQEQYKAALGHLKEEISRQSKKIQREAA